MWGLGPSDLKPDLVYKTNLTAHFVPFLRMRLTAHRISGYGQTGPKATLPGLDGHCLVQFIEPYPEFDTPAPGYASVVKLREGLGKDRSDEPPHL